MRKTDFVLLCGLAALPAAAADRLGVIMSGSGTLESGITVRFTTVAEPPMKGDPVFPGGIIVRRDRIHRYMCDNATGQYFGYDLLVSPEGASKRFRVNIERLSLEAGQLRLGSHVAATTPILLPRYPPPQVVEPGDTIVLDLLASPDGRQKVMDYIEVSPPSELPPAAGSGEPRDFTLDDGPLEFNFRAPSRMFVNGREWSGIVGTTVKPGATLWLAAPGRGRYVLSLSPREGFAKAGAIRGHTLAFRSDGEEYEFRASGPVLGAGGAWNLYVMRDPSYSQRPGAISLGVDRLENLLAKK
jgi:hypothetical protein